MIERLREKYRSRDIIEIDTTVYKAAVQWLGVGSFDPSDIKTTLSKFISTTNQFTKFLDSGVIFYILENGHIIPFAFEFTSEQSLRVTIPIKNLDFQDGGDILDYMTILCKVDVDLFMDYKVVDGTMNQELYNSLTEELKLKTQRFRQTLSAETTIIDAYAVVATINAYLTLLQKEILITTVEQRRQLQRGNGRRGRHNMRNPFFRYVVTLPPDYQPRSLNANYFVSTKMVAVIAYHSPFLNHS